MHMVIRAIVYAKTETAAKTQAQKIFEQLTRDQRPFDYFTMFAEPGLGVSGSDRWEGVPAIALADSEEGRKLIAEGMEATKKQFDRYIGYVRQALANFSDEDLFEGRGISVPMDESGRRPIWANADMVRYFMKCLGQYTGSSVWLYDSDGEGIRTPAHLERALNKWQTLYEDQKKPNPHADEAVWVVPADVHF